MLQRPSGRSSPRSYLDCRKVANNTPPLVLPILSTIYSVLKVV